MCSYLFIDFKLMNFVQSNSFNINGNVDFHVHLYILSNVNFPDS